MVCPMQYQSSSQWVQKNFEVLLKAENYLNFSIENVKNTQ